MTVSWSKQRPRPPKAQYSTSFQTFLSSCDGLVSAIILTTMARMLIELVAKGWQLYKRWGLKGEIYPKGTLPANFTGTIPPGYLISRIVKEL
jgi:hypothetical protein